MFRFLGFSSRKPAPQPPPEPADEPTPDFERDGPASATSPTTRKRRLSDADGGSSSPSQRPARRRRLATDVQLSPQRPPSERSCPSEAEQSEAQLPVLIPRQTDSSTLRSPRPSATRTPERNASTTVESEAARSEKRPPAKPRTRPAPTSDSEADGHVTQSSFNENQRRPPRKARQSVDLSTPTHTNGQNMGFSYGTGNQHDFARKNPPSQPPASVRKPAVRYGRPRKIPKVDLIEDQDNDEGSDAEHVNNGVHESTPAKHLTGNASKPSCLASPQKYNEDGEKEQGGQVEDDDGRVAIIKSKSNPEAIPIMLNEDVTDKKYTISSIVDHRRDAEIDHAFELSVRWVNFTEPSWESERSIQAQVPDLLYKYWDSVGGRPITGAFRVFTVLRHWSAQPPRGGARGPKPKKRTKYLVQWEGYSADPEHTSVETEEKLRDIAPHELDIYLEHVREQRRADLRAQAM
ncbi:hypothetical protein MAPG_08174 [Magnaporthiopsis poae ATCC 64411]|uniref:Chromo domain-containing protein n=1 Tax=Magnaporthiopsis poae (strain ATCC 64411 / 73-15) TaxID=644358 RepID=A0A0C4E6N0_MAGP6|nr:hypothetical protein MAPG_08174 [Magnaporthiopsis poae ATCC 64411]